MGARGRDAGRAGGVGRRGGPVGIMHNRETADPALDILADIAAFLARSLAIADAAGIARERIVIDPGIGFGKTQPQSIETLARLDRLKTFGLPLLVGASRKRFIYSVSPAPPHRLISGPGPPHLLATPDRAPLHR